MLEEYVKDIYYLRSDTQSYYPFRETHLNATQHKIITKPLKRGIYVKGTVSQFLLVDDVKYNYYARFVCVEVLRPSQPNGVMLSMVSLPNHTFIRQA